MDKMEKQLRDLLGNDAVTALEGLVNNETERTRMHGRLVGEIMEGLSDNLPKDIEERLAEASKDAAPADMVLIVPPGPSRIGRMPDLHRGLSKPMIVIPLEMSDREISERGMKLIKELGEPIAIDCQMNADGSLSFGVVPPDEDHPPLVPIVEVGGYADKFKGRDVNPNNPKPRDGLSSLTGRLKLKDDQEKK